jgi:hypothetical protein
MAHTADRNRQPHRSHRDDHRQENKDGAKTAVTINYHA